MDESPVSRKRELIATLAVLIVVVAIVAAVTVANKKKTSSDAASVSDAATTQSTTQSPSTSSETNSSTPTTYKDGSYTSTGSYDSPGGEESIKVSVTLQNGVVTATSATSGANDPEAQEYQDDFIAAYKQQVVGKNIADVSLSRLSGSSLTSQGFNGAIQKIKSQAQA